MVGRLIMICGLPGAGKTTLAKKLEEERHAIRLCPDEWIIPIMKDPADISELDRLRVPVEQLLWEHAQTLLKLGMTVIMENGFWPDWEREQYRKQAKELGAKVELYFLNTPLEVLWERIEKRNQTADITIQYNDLLSFAKKFNPPTAEEGKLYDSYTEYNNE